MKGRIVQVEIVLGRKIVNEILLTYLPTILILLIVYLTSYFKPFYFEATVTVNLTGIILRQSTEVLIICKSSFPAMLVLTTMFISTSNGLPKTSYVKMIDVWFIYNLLFTLIEVTVATFLEVFIEESEDR